MKMMETNKPKTMSFHTYNDPGHGWLKVHRSLLNMLGIEDKITDYSYQRGEYVFLEEDCDANLLLHTLKDHGIEWVLKYHSTDRRSKIRSYDRYCKAA